MYVSTLNQVEVLATAEQSCWQPSTLNRPSGSSKRQHRSLARYHRLPQLDRYHLESACASGDHLYSTSIPSKHLAEGDKANDIAPTSEPQLPVLPFSLLASLSAAWWLTARCANSLQACYSIANGNMA